MEKNFDYSEALYLKLEIVYKYIGKNCLIDSEDKMISKIETSYFHKKVVDVFTNSNHNE